VHYEKRREPVGSVPRFLVELLVAHLAGKARDDLLFTGPRAGSCATAMLDGHGSTRLSRLTS
jgi:hypothetical protein